MNHPDLHTLSYWKSSGVLAEVKFKASLSGGKGGQHTNKVSTKIELYWTPSDSYVLTEEQKEKVITRLASKLSKEGELRVLCEEERSQIKNKEKAIQKFCLLLSSCFKEKKKRKATKPSKASIARRLESKKKNQQRKQSRQRPETE